MPAFVSIALISPVLAQNCTPGWSQEFFGGDFDGNIRASVAYSDNNGQALYAAGTFTRAGGVRCPGVAKWTGTSWTRVGGDFNGDVNALLVHTDGFLYAGGAFSSVGGTAISRVARWNGTSWVAVSTNALGGTVRALASFPDSNGTSRLWAGGMILSLPAAANGFAAILNGTTWSYPGNSNNTSFTINSFTPFTVQGSLRLFAGGQDNQFPGQGNVRQWYNGSWSSVATGVNGTVYALGTLTTPSGTAVYAAGAFTTAGTGPANHVAQWDGTNWSALGSGVDNVAYALTTFDPDGFGPLPTAIYVGGANTTPQGLPTNSLSSWNGTTWTPYGSGTNDKILTLTPFSLGNQLFVGGAFSRAQGSLASRAGFISNTTGWNIMANSEVGSAPSDLVSAAAWFDDDGAGPHPGRLYVGGDFHRAGPTGANYIAVWDGTNWSALPLELNGPVVALKVFDDGQGPALFAGGNFSSAGGIPASNIARWNGTTWTAMSSGLNGRVLALETYAPPQGAPQLYAAGEFYGSGGALPNGIARWDGVAWNAIPNTPFNSLLYAMKVFDDGTGPRLFVGGQTFVTGSAVMAWNGTSLVPAGAGLFVSSFVDALAVYNNTLYAAGAGFTVNSEGLARWNGTTWSVIPNGPAVQVSALATHDDGNGPMLYVGGYGNTLINGAPADHLMRYDGQTLQNFGAQTEPVVTQAIQSLVSIDEDGSGPGGASLYVLGRFTSIGGISSGNIARWAPCACYANCDRSTEQPILNVNDFQCFLNRFATQDPYTNCDHSTAPPVLNVNDFQCFLNKFAAGCP